MTTIMAPKKVRTPRKKKIPIQLYLEPETVDAIEKYRAHILETLGFKTSQTDLGEKAIRDYLKEKGFWSPERS